MPYITPQKASDMMSKEVYIIEVQIDELEEGHTVNKFALSELKAKQLQRDLENAIRLLGLELKYTIHTREDTIEE